MHECLLHHQVCITIMLHAGCMIIAKCMNTCKYIYSYIPSNKINLYKVLGYCIAGNFRWYKFSYVSKHKALILRCCTSWVIEHP